MADDTPIELRNKVIYEVYVRNHSKEGSFKAVEADLDRIKALGTDILWLMPIHPTGDKEKKGNLGSPYAVKDYRKVNPEYGDLDDFKSLVSAAHDRGMKVMIDIVYNHTAPDSKLLKEDPDWFYRNSRGEVDNKIDDWSDVIDLDYRNKELWDYQIETLKYWARQGVDGFRCDVASLVPLEFWKLAREEVAEVKEDIIWLAETVDPDFLRELRSRGLQNHSDSELYQAFDVTYSYDTFPYLQDYITGNLGLDDYLDKLKIEEYIYPDNYVKLRFLENHDQPRIRNWLTTDLALKNWTAFYYFQQGLTLLYGGQETSDLNTPSLFNKDPVAWDKLDDEYISFLQKLGEIKKDPIFSRGQFRIKELDKEGVAAAVYEESSRKVVGIFNLEQKLGKINVGVSDGEYENLITGRKIKVVENRLELGQKPVIFSVEEK